VIQNVAITFLPHSLNIMCSYCEIIVSANTIPPGFIRLHPENELNPIPPTSLIEFVLNGPLLRDLGGDPNIDGEGEKGYCSTATGLEKREENMGRQKQRGERSNEVLKRGIFTI